MVASAGPTSSHGEPEQNPETERYLNYLNHSLSTNYLYALVALTVIVAVYHNLLRVRKHTRHLVSLSGSKGAQHYFASLHPVTAWLKAHLGDAPLFYHSRAREFKLGRRLVLGVLPTRLQGVFVLAIIVYNVFACVWNIPWSSPELEVLPIFRNRTGSLATVNLIPICVLATIKNPLISVLDISYDSFNLVHRWMGRLAVLEGIVHALCWIIAKVESSGWTAVAEAFTHSSFIYTGLIAVVGFSCLGLHSLKILRSLAYEVFLHSHILLVAMTFGGLWVHLKGLPQQMFLLAAIVIWAGSRVWRLLTLLYRSCGHGGTKAAIEHLPGGAVRVQLSVARPWRARPGQTLYLSIPSIGLWTLHPFSVAWNGSQTDTFLLRSDSTKSKYSETNEKRTLTTKTLEVDEESASVSTRPTTIDLIIKSKSGFTRKLHAQAEIQDGRRVVVPAYVEGPYGHDGSLASFGTVLLFASGVGITHQMLYIRELIHGFVEGTVATRRVTLVWVVTSTDALEWVRQYMQEILCMDGRKEILKILLYVTQAGLDQDIRSPSATVRMLRGRPNIYNLVQQEVSERVGATGISVCGNGHLADDVRAATRMVVKQGVEVSLFEEGFGW